MKVSSIDLLNDWVPDFTASKLHVRTYSSSSVLALARRSEDVRQKYREILSHDFILGDHRDGVSYFGKRTEWTWNRSDILQDEGVFYSLELQDQKYRGMANPKLIVIFSHFGPDSVNAGERTFQPYFPAIRTHIPPNTIILRIVDFNLSHGSFYLNTRNYLDFEERIQRLIRKIIRECGAKEEEVVLLGSSKGATGALIHGLMGNYRVLSVDPIVDDNHYVNEKNDWHFMKGTRELNFGIKIREAAEISQRDDHTFVIANSKVPETFQQIMKISDIRKLKVFDTRNPLAYENHSLVGPTAKSEIVTLLNALLNQKLMDYLRG